MRSVLISGCAVAALFAAIGGARAELEPPVTLPPPILDAATRAPIPPPDPPEAMLQRLGVAEGAALKSAIAAYDGRRLEEGDRLAATLRHPAAKTLAEWIAIRRNVVSFERITRFLRDNPDWPGQTFLRRRAEERLIAERASPAQVRAFFRETQPASGLGRLALGFALAADAPDEALALIREVWRTETLSDALEQRVLAAFGPKLTFADHRARAERMAFRKNGNAALRAAARAEDGFSTLIKARLAAARGSGKAVQKAIDAVPAPQRALPGYRFAKAQVLARAGKYKEAAAEIAGVTRDPAALGDGDAWWDFRRYVARELLDLGLSADAYRVASEHGAESAAHRIEAEFHAGWIALRFLGNADDAALHFGRASAIATTPISRARADYWLGRAAEADDRNPDAALFYARASEAGITYYGQLARGRLGLPEPAIRVAARLEGEQRAAFEARPAIQAAHLMEALGPAELTHAYYRELAQTLDSDAELAAVSGIARHYRDATAMLAIGKIATQRGFALDEHAFPTFGVPIEQAAAPAPVDPAMVYAITRQESAFSVDAQAHAGARGLMQLMPATARMTATQIGRPFELERLTTDGAYNAQLGAAHLKDLMRDWRGSYILTFASYNAGGGNVKKWIDAYGDPRDPAIDPVDWVERIPFHETRNYVQRVMENLKVYRHRLEGEDVLLRESDLKAGTRSR